MVIQHHNKQSIAHFTEHSMLKSNKPYYCCVRMRYYATVWLDFGLVCHVIQPLWLADHGLGRSGDGLLLYF